MILSDDILDAPALEFRQHSYNRPRLRQILLDGISYAGVALLIANFLRNVADFNEDFKPSLNLGFYTTFADFKADSLIASTRR